MHRLTSRGGRLLLALTFVGLGACADEPAAPRIPSLSGPNANLGDVITVTTSSGGKEAGSLRWAVAQTTGGEIIRFAPALAGATIVVDSLIPVLYPITIEGPADKGVTISGGNATYIFEVYGLPSATTFRNLALVNGTGNGSAGGGGIVATSDIVLENMTLSNHTGSDFAAFYTDQNATFINTTISSNTTTGNTGAAFVGKKLTLVNSTIAYNNKGGVDVRGPLAMRNSIIANNGAGANCQNVPTFERTGRNLASDSSCGDSTVMLIAAPKLDSLRDNGGPGKTHALNGASPAINAGTDCTVTVDQRYVPRDANCDLGAYEFKDFTTVTLTNNASLPVDPTTGWVFVAGSVTCSTDETFDLAVEVSQERKAGQASEVVKATGKVTVTCSESAQPWGLALAPSSGEFGIGNAVVTTKTEAGPWIIPATASTPVKLYRGRK